MTLTAAPACALYVRVSTPEQDLAGQERELRELGAVAEHGQQYDSTTERTELVWAALDGFGGA